MCTKVGRRDIDVDTDYGMSFCDLGVVSGLLGSFALLTSSNSLHQVLLGHSILSIVFGLSCLGVVL